MAGSLAIMSDAAHLLSDCISFIVALLAIIWAKKSPDNYMTFGYKRIGKCSLSGHFGFFFSLNLNDFDALTLEYAVLQRFWARSYQYLVYGY